MQKTFSLQVLHVMFVDARASAPPSRNRLCARLGSTPANVDAALAGLERAGLVDARRVRLTLAGLAVAASQRTASKGREPERGARRGEAPFAREEKALYAKHPSGAQTPADAVVRGDRQRATA